VIAAQEKGLLVLADVKRGDLGSTAEAYAEGHFGLIGADAITVNPYLGRDSLEPYLAHCRAAGKGIYVLVKTSNPGSADLQDLWTGDARSRAASRRWSATSAPIRRSSDSCGLSAVGAVTGATYPDEIAQLRLAIADDALPAARLRSARRHRGGLREGVSARRHGAIVNSSRGITFAFRSGDHAERFGEKRWRDSVAAAVYEMGDALAAVSTGAKTT